MPRAARALALLLAPLEAELRHVLMLPDFDRATDLASYGATRRHAPFGELLIDIEEDPPSEPWCSGS
jgi:hypothetical protein